MIIGYVIMDKGGTPLIKDQLIPTAGESEAFLTPLLSVLNQLSGKVINGTIKHIETSGQQLYMESNHKVTAVITSTIKNEAVRSIANELLQILDDGNFGSDKLEYDLEAKRKAKQRCTRIITNKYSQIQSFENYKGKKIPKSEVKALKQIEAEIGEPPEFEVEDQVTTMLNLKHKDLSDLTPLCYLLNLTRLNLHGTKVSDVTPLKRLKGLRVLDLGNTNVVDVTSLKTLKNLEVLRIGNTDLADLTSLQHLENLKELKLNMTKVTDLSPLLELDSLEHLVLWYTDISENDPVIKKLTKKGVEVKI